MKLKRKNILYFLMIGIALTFGVNNIKAVTLNEEKIGGVVRKTVEGTYNSGSHRATIKNGAGEILTGFVRTHAMTVSFSDGTVTDAYCAWYEISSPDLSGKQTFYALTSKEFPDKYAVGAASIINAEVQACSDYNKEKKDEEEGHVLTPDDCERAIKTTALNIYLTKRNVLAGKKCDSSSDRIDGAITKNWGGFGALSSIKGDIDKIINYYDPNITSTIERTGGDDYAKYYKAVYDLVKNAMNEDENYDAPKLDLTGDRETFELDSSGNNYIITYTASATGYGIISNSVKATVTGVSTYKTTSIGNKITISIPKAVYEGATGGIKAEITAKIDFKKLYIFTTLAGINNTDKFRCKYQDLIFTLDGVGIDYIEISAESPYKKCYKYDITCSDTQCKNTNQNNERTCNSQITTYQSLACDSNDIANNEIGKKMFTYGNGCNLYCTEKAIASYPGNVYPRVELGTKLVWPTANGEGVYPLITKGTLTCTITPNSGVSMDYCISEAQKTNFKYNTSASGKLTYNDLSKDVDVSLKGTCSTSQNVNGTIVTITNSCNYSLADKSYNAFNKDTLQAVELDKSAFAKADNYILTKERILSIGNINKTLYSDLAKVLDGEYKLQISDLSLGHDNQFTSELNKTAYVCKYQVTDEAKAQNECSCPPGTEQAGQNLLGTIIRINGEATSESQMITCAEAQHLYCNCNGGDCPDNPDENPVCPSNTAYPGISLAGCISDGNSENECIKNNCYEYCPLESDKPGQDISACIKDYMSKGKDKWKAYDLCVEKEKCYNPCHGAACIIYRTISLEVPFVGKSASTSLKSTFIDKSTFRNIGLSQGLDLYRYPGSNWNSPSLVYNKIWNNRGYKASELYQEVTPLYTINLDPTSIKTIREYNKTHEYSDFTLSCTDGAYCISSFLRSGIKNADKTDILDATASTCANASNKTTFISCYTSK